MSDLVQRLRGGVYGINRIPLCLEAADEIERLTAELASARQDAARYRWLANDSDGNAQDDFTMYLRGHVLSRSEFDAAIDAAIGEKA